MEAVNLARPNLPLQEGAGGNHPPMETVKWEGDTPMEAVKSAEQLGMFLALKRSNNYIPVAGSRLWSASKVSISIFPIRRAFSERTPKSRSGLHGQTYTQEASKAYTRCATDKPHY